LRAFWAAEAARQQGEGVFHSFHIALLKAKHEQQRDIANFDTLFEIANKTSLKMSQFKTDLSNQGLLGKLAKDHTFAVEELNVFGTPTLVFPENQAIFLKMSPSPSHKECLPIFNELFNLAYSRRNIHEVKRP
jgi:predicted DsbA family dithiol-disulfide isomerase